MQRSTSRNFRRARTLHRRLPARGDRAPGKRPEGGRIVLRQDARRAARQHVARGDALPARQRCSSRRASYDEAKTSPTPSYAEGFPAGRRTLEEAVYRIALASLFARQATRTRSRAWRIISSEVSCGQFRQRREVPPRRVQVRDEASTTRSSPALSGVAQAVSRRLRSRVRSRRSWATRAPPPARPTTRWPPTRTSFKTATTDEVLNYSIMTEAGKILQKRGDVGSEDAAMFHGFRQDASRSSVGRDGPLAGRPRRRSKLKARSTRPSNSSPTLCQEVHRRLPPGFGRANPRSTRRCCA